MRCFRKCQWVDMTNIYRVSGKLPTHAAALIFEEFGQKSDDLELNNSVHKHI